MPNPVRGKPKLNIGPTGRTVAFNVQRLRKWRGHTQTALAALLTEAGRRMSLSSLSEIELGTRRVDVDDLAALAAVLQVSPNALLLPPVRGSALACEVTGFGLVGTNEAWRWADGRGMDGWDRGQRFMSRPNRIEDPDVRRAEARQQMLDRLIEAAGRRQTTLKSTVGVPAGALTAVADELQRLRGIDPADETYWKSEDIDPAIDEEPPVSDQLAQIPGIETIVAVTSASADDHS